MKSGIYKIENIVNKKVYIGESFDIERRWEHHRNSLLKGNHGNYLLQNDCDICGIECFEFSILQNYKANNPTITQVHLLMLENAWITFYLDSGFTLYNIEDSLTEVLLERKKLQICSNIARSALIYQIENYKCIKSGNVFSVTEINQIETYLKNNYILEESKSSIRCKAQSLSKKINKELDDSDFKIYAFDYKDLHSPDICTMKTKELNDNGILKVNDYMSKLNFELKETEKNIA